MVKNKSRTGTPGEYELSEAPTIGDIKRFLARLIQRVDRGRVSIRKGNCLAQIANVLINSVLDHELEQRLIELEANHAAGWRPSESRTIHIKAGGSHEAERKPSGTA